jgi:thiamine biosynthesis lipoprotein
MKKEADIMGMGVRVEIVDTVNEQDIEEVFEYLRGVDAQFSPYKSTSEVEKINRGKIEEAEYSREMRHVLDLAEQTKQETNGYFDVWNEGRLDPSGIVKGYAIWESAKLLKKTYENFSVEIAGDAQVCGSKSGQKWKVGVKNPFNPEEIIKVFELTDRGIATSGNYARGEHIYDPVVGKKANEIASVTVIGPNAYEADRMATAAFAMGEKGIEFIEQLDGFEGYMVKKDKTAVMTSGIDDYLN